MLKRTFICFLISFSFVKSQPLDSLTAGKFILSLAENNKHLSSFVSTEELAISSRLGVSYEGIENKFLISYELDSAVAAGIISGKLKYSYTIETAAKDYSILHINVPQKNYAKEYYFKNGLLISPPSYYAKEWETFEDGYFKFFISDPESFNPYCAEALNSFINETAKALDFTEEDLRLLKEKKIHYYLCRNDNEIKQLTGYSALGMFNLAYDYIITTYTCHYHELVHLLMNFRLKNIPLYTSTFLQEGIAVALGGRGGKAPGVILDMGAFIINSDFLDYTLLLNKTQFTQTDASMSYAISGLYNLFLLQNLEADNYLKLYCKYSGNVTDNLNIRKSDLPDESAWRKFAAGYKSQSLITPNPVYDPASQKIFAARYKIYDGGDSWIFSVKDTVIINTGGQLSNYNSRIYNEVIPHKEYNGMRYLITSGADEISIYDLYTNELIGKYVSSFNANMETVKEEKKYYRFSISKKAFKNSNYFDF